MIPNMPATMEAASEAYKNKARFHALVQQIVAEEMRLADRALTDCTRDPYRVHETAHYLATSVAARVLQTVYDNDGELQELQKEVEQLSRSWREAVELNLGKPPPITVQTRGSHETYIDAKGCLCRHCGLRWGLGEREPPGPCVWPRIET